MTTVNKGAYGAEQIKSTHEDNFRMKRITALAAIMLLAVGCLTKSNKSYFDKVGNCIIPEIELREMSIQQAVNCLRSEWTKQTGTQLPIAEIQAKIEYVESKSNNISFHARNISFLNAFRAIATIAGCRIIFYEKEVVVIDIMPNEYTSVLWALDSETKKALGLSKTFEAKDILFALAERGLDATKGDLLIDIVQHSGELILRGDAEQVELAKCILILSSNGYEIRGPSRRWKLDK